MCECKVCKSDNVSVFSEIEEVKYKTGFVNVKTLYSVCNNCGREFISKEQIINNENELRDKKREFDGFLTSTELKAAREKLKITQKQASEIFGGGANAFSKYERGEVTQSSAMDKLIRLALKSSFIFHSIAEESGIALNYDDYEGNIIYYSSYKESSSLARSFVQNKNRDVFSTEICSEEVAYG